MKKIRYPRSALIASVMKMGISELEEILRQKIVEKLGKEMPVSLVDKVHAKCGLCRTVISLNSKFEISNLLRHFSAWHPSTLTHKCAGSGLSNQELSTLLNRPLSTMDIAILDYHDNSSRNIQCLWCGFFMDEKGLATHFAEFHFKELIVNAQLTEKYGREFRVTLPDELHFKFEKFNTVFNSVDELEQAIKSLAHIQPDLFFYDDPIHEQVENYQHQSEEEMFANSFDTKQGLSCSAFSNSRASLGSSRKPKRQFIKPALRQATPINSPFVEPLGEFQWRCKLCNKSICGAVMSAAAIRHFKSNHPTHQQSIQQELCELRLERMGKGCMVMLSPYEIECLLCHILFPLHQPFNMCRAIRHLKAKHPERMPEYQAIDI